MSSELTETVREQPLEILPWQRGRRESPVRTSCSNSWSAAAALVFVDRHGEYGSLPAAFELKLSHASVVRRSACYTSVLSGRGSAW